MVGTCRSLKANCWECRWVNSGCCTSGLAEPWLPRSCSGCVNLRRGWPLLIAGTLPKRQIAWNITNFDGNTRRSFRSIAIPLRHPKRGRAAGGDRVGSSLLSDPVRKSTISRSAMRIALIRSTSSAVGCLDGAAAREKNRVSGRTGPATNFSFVAQSWLSARPANEALSGRLCRASRPAYACRGTARMQRPPEESTVPLA